MKRCWMILLAAALLLTGCRREPPAEGPALTDDITYMPVVEAADLASAGITLADDPHGVPSQATTEITEQGIFFFDWDAGLDPDALIRREFDVNGGAAVAVANIGRSRQRSGVRLGEIQLLSAPAGGAK